MSEINSEDYARTHPEAWEDDPDSRGEELNEQAHERFLQEMEYKMIPTYEN